MHGQYNCFCQGGQVEWPRPKHCMLQWNLNFENASLNRPGSDASSGAVIEKDADSKCHRIDA